MDLGTVSFDDLFDFSPEPPPDLGENSYELEKEKMRLSGDDWPVGGQQTEKSQQVRTITTNHQVKTGGQAGQVQIKTEHQRSV